MLHKPLSKTLLVLLLVTLWIVDESSDPPEDDSDRCWWEKVQKSWPELAYVIYYRRKRNIITH